MVRSPRRLYVMALAKGPTTIFALDKDGRQIAILSINSTDRDIGALAGILKTVHARQRHPGPGGRRHRHPDRHRRLGGRRAAGASTSPAPSRGYTAVGRRSGGGGGGGGGSVSVSAGTPQVVQGRLINSLVIRGQDQVMLKVSIVEIRRDVVKQLGVNLTNSWQQRSRPAARPAPSRRPSARVRQHRRPAFFSGQKNSLSRDAAGLRKQRRRPYAGRAQRHRHLGRDRQVPGRRDHPDPAVVHRSLDDTGIGLPTCNYIQQQYGVTLNFTPTVLSGGRISLHVSTAVIEPDQRGHTGGQHLRLHPRLPPAPERDHGGAALGRLDRIGRPRPADEPADALRHAGPLQPADPGCAVPLAPVPAQRDAS